MGALSLKVAESANAAIWDSTSRVMHDVPAHSWSQYSAAPRWTETVANGRYEDFDALRSRGTTITQVFTRAENMRVDCRVLLQRDGLQPSAPAALADPAYVPQVGEHGIVCSARATLSGFRIPRNFLDGDLSKVQHYRPLVIPVCAVGRPSSGNCPGQLGMLLDDWGYSGPAEAQECPLAPEGGTGCANQGYYDQVSSIYTGSGSPYAGSASRLATVVSGGSPINEDFFYMSFRGWESDFKQSLISSHGDLTWETTPYKARTNTLYNYSPHYNCWLGNQCR
jgi:hypothetical protein